MSDRYIISSPRSGLNWVRFCTEHYFGKKTPGKMLLIGDSNDTDYAFERSHGPLGLARKNGTGPWQRIDTKVASDGRVVLIIRDPLEAFVRMAKCDLKLFRSYIGNIRFYSAIPAQNRKVFYYNDLITDALAMAQLFEFLEFEPAEGFSAPSVEKMADEWEYVSKKSRNNYDTKHPSGSQTKNDPLNFKFHQQALSERRKIRVWRFLQQNLTAEEFRLLDRFDCDLAQRPVGIFMKLQERFINPKT